MHQPGLQRLSTQFIPRCVIAILRILIICLAVQFHAAGAQFQASFETDPFASSEHGWIRSSGDDQARWQWTAPVRDKSGAIMISSPTSWALCRPTAADLLPVQVGEAVHAQAKVANLQGTGWTYITIEWFDKDRQPLPVDPSESGKVAPDQDWVTVTVQAKVPPAAALAGVGLRVGSNRGQAHFTDVSARTVKTLDQSGALDQTPLFPADAQLNPADYVQVVDGHFSKGGKRLRLWGSQSSPLGTTHAEIDEEVARFRALGFNMYRSISVDSLFNMNYSPGDSSRMDLQDYTFAAIARSGGFNWIDLINNFRVTELDVDIVDDPNVSRADWLEAMKGKSLRPSAPLFVWDRRAREIYFRHIDALMEHRNPYTNLRYADDPSIALIELVNEQWWTPTMLGGADLATLHPALVRPLLLKWNRWLQAKYHDTTTLQTAWGELLPAESLEHSTVLLQPLQGSAALDQMATVLGLGVKSDEKAPRQIPGNAQRGRDVVQFFVETHREFKQQALDRLRSHGKPGVGASVVPVIIDTGASYSPQSAYEHTIGSGFAFGWYGSLIDTSAENPKTPWSAPLLQKPDLGNWMVQNKIENLPAIIYETMIFEPAKYRADYPLRLAAFAAIQDLDVVDWHFYDKHFFGANAKPLPMPNAEFYWQGVIFGGDEVMLASQVLAGNILLHGGLQTPKDPTVLVVGQDVLYGESGNWASLGKTLSATAMQFGLRLRFDPNAKTSHFIGNSTDQYSEVVKPTPEISYRWKEGMLVIESPRVLLLAGFVPERFEFSGGEIIQNISVKSPPESAFASADERYVCFALCSRDGKTLADSGDIIATAVSTSCNTGFSFDPAKFNAAQKQRNHPPISAAAALTEGTLPVLVSRVGWQLKASWLHGMTAKKKDFSMKCYAEQKCPDGSISVSPDEALFLLELTRP